MWRRDNCVSHIKTSFSVWSGRRFFGILPLTLIASKRTFSKRNMVAFLHVVFQLSVTLFVRCRHHWLLKLYFSVFYAYILKFYLLFNFSLWLNGALIFWIYPQPSTIRFSGSSDKARHNQTNRLFFLQTFCVMIVVAFNCDSVNNNFYYCQFLFLSMKFTYSMYLN